MIAIEVYFLTYEIYLHYNEGAVYGSTERSPSCLHIRITSGLENIGAQRHPVPRETLSQLELLSCTSDEEPSV